MSHPPEQERLTWLATIYQTYAADLQRYIYGKVGELALAEDLTSTVFLKALRWLREDQSAESVRGWLYATARTTIVDHWQAFGHTATYPIVFADLSPIVVVRGMLLGTKKWVASFFVSYTLDCATREAKREA